MRAKASGPGNVIMVIGADTGRDGFHGATFASVDDPEASHRGVIQVGNPFLEKLLMEACLELLAGRRRRGDAGSWRGRHDLVDSSSAPAGAASAPRSTSRWFHVAKPGMTRLRGDAEREPGADAAGRPAGRRRAGCRDRRPLVAARSGDRPCHRRRHGAGPRWRRRRCEVPALLFTDECPTYIREPYVESAGDLERRTPRSDRGPGPRRGAGSGRRSAAVTSRVAEYRQPASRVRALRSHDPDEYRRASRAQAMPRCCG